MTIEFEMIYTIIELNSFLEYKKKVHFCFKIHYNNMNHFFSF